MEEIDMNMTEVYFAMDEGFEILNEEKDKERREEKDFYEFRTFLTDGLEKLMDDPIRPYARLIDLYFPINLPVRVMKELIVRSEKYGGWFEISIPDFALMACHINMMGEGSYFVFNPKQISDGLTHSEKDWNEITLHRNIRDHRVALALAKQAWAFYLKEDQEAGKATMPAEEVPNHKAEVYEPMDEPEVYIDALQNTFIISLIDQRLKSHNLI